MHGLGPPGLEGCAFRLGVVVPADARDADRCRPPFFEEGPLGKLSLVPPKQTGGGLVIPASKRLAETPHERDLVGEARLR